MNRDQGTAVDGLVNEGDQAGELPGEEAYRENDSQVGEVPSNGGLGNGRLDGDVFMRKKVLSACKGAELALPANLSDFPRAIEK